jgi:hypothetical protein
MEPPNPASVYIMRYHDILPPAIRQLILQYDVGNRNTLVRNLGMACFHGAGEGRLRQMLADYMRKKGLDTSRHDKQDARRQANSPNPYVKHDKTKADHYFAEQCRRLGDAG